MLKSLFVFSHNEMNVLGHVLHAKHMLGKRQGASVPAGYLHWLIPGATDSIGTTNTQFSSFLFSLLQGFIFSSHFSRITAHHRRDVPWHDFSLGQHPDGFPISSLISAAASWPPAALRYDRNRHASRKRKRAHIKETKRNEVLSWLSCCSDLKQSHSGEKVAWNNRPPDFSGRHQTSHWHVQSAQFQSRPAGAASVNPTP